MKIRFFYILFLLNSFSSFSQEWKEFKIGEDFEALNFSFLEFDEKTNSVWLCYKSLARKFDQGTVTTNYDFNEMTNIYDVDAIHIDDDTLYATSALYGLFMYENGTSTLLSSNITGGKGIFKDVYDTLWVASSNSNNQAFYGFKNGNYVFYNTVNSGMELNVSSKVIKDNYNRLWSIYWNNSNSGNGYGVDMRGVENNWTFYNPNNSQLPTYHVKEIIEDKNNNIWAATKYGFCRFDEVAQDWVVYNKNNTNLPSDCITDIDFDKQGRIWVMMKDTALAYSYNYTDWTIFDETNSPITFGDGLSNEFVIDTLDNVWVRDHKDLKVLNLNGFGDSWLSTESNQLKEVNVNIYPNPTSNILNVSGVDENTKFTIYNLIGQPQSVAILNNNIDVSLLPTGTYLLHVNTEKGNVVKRFIKN